MTAKEYLNQGYKLDQRINSKLMQIENLESLTQRITASYGGEVVSHTRNVTSMQDNIIKLMEAKEDVNRQIAELVDLKLEITKTIGRVRNDDYRMILEMRYLCFKSWNEIALSMHYSKRWVMNRHDRAVEVIESILKHN